MTSHPLSLEALATVCGGADTKQQAQLRELARKHCPRTFAANQDRPITRPLAERCLDEAGYGQYRGMLDRYFPPR
jgi:hypothetical protein